MVAYFKVDSTRELIYIPNFTIFLVREVFQTLVALRGQCR